MTTLLFKLFVGAGRLPVIHVITLLHVSTDRMPAITKGGEKRAT